MRCLFFRMSQTTTYSIAIAIWRNVADYLTNGSGNEMLNQKDINLLMDALCALEHRRETNTLLGSLLGAVSAPNREVAEERMAQVRAEDMRREAEYNILKRDIARVKVKLYDLLEECDKKDLNAVCGSGSTQDGAARRS